VPGRPIVPMRSLLWRTEVPSPQNIPSGSAAQRCYHLAIVRIGWSLFSEKKGLFRGGL
jgi:hypothetical protein